MGKFAPKKKTRKLVEGSSRNLDFTVFYVQTVVISEICPFLAKKRLKTRQNPLNPK